MTEEEKKAIENLSMKSITSSSYETKEYPNMICSKKDVITVLNLIKKQQKENEKAYLQGFNDSEEKYNTVIAENMKLKSELAKKDKCIMKLKNFNKRLMKKR